MIIECMKCKKLLEVPPFSEEAQKGICAKCNKRQDSQKTGEY